VLQAVTVLQSPSAGLAERAQANQFLEQVGVQLGAARSNELVPDPEPFPSYAVQERRCAHIGCRCWGNDQCNTAN
jgi:hypothetical protein